MKDNELLRQLLNKSSSQIFDPYFDSVPLSENEAYKTSRYGKIYLIQKGKDYKAKVKQQTLDYIKENQLEDYVKSFKDKELSCTISIWDTWYNQNKTIKRKDVQNMPKLFVDAVFSALREIEPSLDDKQIWSMDIWKESEEDDNEVNPGSSIYLKAR